VSVATDAAGSRWMPAVFIPVWSTGFIVARYAAPYSPPITFLSLRYAFSVLCFGLWILWSRPAWPRERAQWLHLSVTGVLMHAGYLGCVWAAVKAGMGAGTVALLVGLQPVLTAVWISASQPAGGAAPRVSRQQWLGLVLGLAGLVLVVWHKLGAGEVGPWNFTLAVVALFSITAGTLYQKRHVVSCDVRTANTVQLSAALLVSLPVAWMEPAHVVLHPHMIGSMVWSVLGLTLGGSSLFYILIQRGAATQVTSLLYLVPPCTALMAWVLFGEPLTPSMVLGMAMTALGVAMVLRPRARGVKTS